jgi:putative sigma-54 modulation protein
MKITTTARHYELSPALKDYAESKISNLTTFYDNIVNAHIIFSLEKYRHLVEVTLHINGRDIVAHDVSEDMYASVDNVAEKLERQILKHKGKLHTKKPRKRAVKETVPASEEPEASKPVTENEIIPADPIEFPTLTMDEAVSTLRTNGKGFSIFSNRVTHRLTVLYKREDGSIGLIEA